MAFGLNRAEVIGRLGDNVAINHLASGGRVANMSIATDESYIDRQTGERVDRTEWHRVVTFQNGLVDMLDKHAKKGRLIYVAGKLQTRRWRKDGEDSDRFSTEILLVPGGRVQFLDKPANGNGAPASNGEATPPATSGRGRSRRHERYPVLAGSSLPLHWGRFRVRPGAEPALLFAAGPEPAPAGRRGLRFARRPPSRLRREPERGRNPVVSPAAAREVPPMLFNSAHGSGFAGAVMRARRAP